MTTTVAKNNDTVTTNTASANAETTHIPRDKASHGLDETEGLTMINRTITVDAVNMTCKMTTNNGMTATSRNTDNDNTTTGHTTTADGETVNPNTNTFTILKHTGLNPKGFKQSSLYIAELLSDADTVSISETWLRPGELCIIKSTLMNTPALNVLNDEDIVIYEYFYKPVKIVFIQCDVKLLCLFICVRQHCTRSLSVILCVGSVSCSECFINRANTEVNVLPSTQG